MAIERGPVYGVELLESLPLDGGSMRQALPSRRDLEHVRKVNERTAAGYEVLLEHYRRLQAENGRLRAKLQRVRDWLMHLAYSEGGIVKEIDDELQPTEDKSNGDH